MLLISAAFAADPAPPRVLVPEFTPASVSDVNVAWMLYESLVADLERRGLDVVDADEIAAAAGERGLQCADNPECPSNLWSYTPAPMAIVGKVTVTDLGVDISLVYYAPADSSPVASVHEEASGGAEKAIIEEAGAKAVDLMQILVLGYVPPPPPPPEEPPEPVAPVEPVTPPVVPTGSERKPLEITTPEEGEGTALAVPPRSELGVSQANYELFLASGLEAEAWMAAERVRTGRITLELQAGWISGAVNRSYDARVALEEQADDSFEVIAIAEQDLWLHGSAPSFGGALGVMIGARAELSLSGGVHGGEKLLTTGWSVPAAGQSESNSPEEVGAWVGLIEPRVRVYALERGVFKPYVLGGLQVRFTDSLVTPDTELVTYPDRPAVHPFSAVVGGGFALDLTPSLALVVEVPYAIGLSGVEPWTVNEGGLELPGRDWETNLMRVQGGLQIKL